MSSSASHPPRRKDVTLQSTKIVLRSLINSSTRPMTARDLDEDHRQCEGRSIPFVELGYRSLEAFLQSLTDTLICRTLQDGTCCVYAIQSAQSMHITTLVRNQKKPTKCSGNRLVQVQQQPMNRTRRNPNNNGIINQVSKNLIAQIVQQNNVTRRRPNNPHQPIQNVQPQQPQHPAPMPPPWQMHQWYLQQLHHSQFAPQMHPHHQFLPSPMHSHHHHHPFPPQMHIHQHPHQFAQTMPHHPQFQAHHRQPQQMPPNFHQQAPQQRQQRRYPPTQPLKQQQAPNQKPQQPAPAPPKQPQPPKPQPPKPQPATAQPPMQQSQPQAKNQPAKMQQQQPQPSQQSQPRSEPRQLPPVQQQLQAQSQTSQAPVFCPNPVPVSAPSRMLPADIISISSDDVPSSRMLPADIISISSDDDAVTPLPAPLPRQQHPQPHIQARPRTLPIDPACFSHPTSEIITIGSDDSSQACRPPSTTSATSAQPGARSLTQILSKTYLCQLPAPVPPVPVSRAPTALDEMALPQLDDNDPLFMSDLPDNVAKFDTKLPPPSFPASLTEGSVFRLFVSEVNSPTKFWFHLQDDNHPLDALMLSIENYYANAPAALQMRHFNAIPDLLCAARFNGLWHRAIIVERMRPDRTVKVHFVDYGTTSAVPLIDIQYLLMRYAKLPVQAHRGALDGVQPPLNERKWSRDSSYVFLDMVSDMMLYGRIMRIDAPERVVRLMLVNTTRGAEDVILHKVLLQRGFASVLPDKIDSRTRRPYRHYSEEYPTFEMLENGSYPSFGEVGILMANGTDYEALFDQNWTKPNEIVLPPQRFHHTNPFAQDLFERPPAPKVDVAAQANRLQNVTPKPDPEKELNI